MAKEAHIMDNGWMDWQVTSGVDIVAGEFVVVSCDGADHPRYKAVSDLLERIRHVLMLDVLFVAQWMDGRPLVRYPADEGLDPEVCDPLESAYGTMLLEGRPAVSRTAPIALGTLSLPVVGREGRQYGSLCCRVDLDPGRFGGRTQQEALQSVAKLVASALDDAQPSGFDELPPMPTSTPARAASEMAFA